MNGDGNPPDLAAAASGPAQGKPSQQQQSPSEHLANLYQEGSKQQSQGNGSSSSNKRPAFSGQWKTPPTMYYPTVSSSGSTSAVAPAAPAGGPPAENNGNKQQQVMPMLTAADYAKALEQAYRKGAAAAKQQAVAAQQQNQPPPPPHQQQQQQQQQQQLQLPQATSCPEFQQQPPQLPAAVAQQTAPVVPQQQQQQHLLQPMPQMQTNSNMMPPPPPLPQVTPVTASAAGGMSSTLYLPPQNQQTAAQAQQQQQQLPAPVVPVAPAPAARMVAAATAEHVSSAALAMPPPPPAQQQQQVGHNVGMPPPTAALQQIQHRAMSLPDMASYAARQEEEKRKKRLARNRASARLRRLRKKNLVDAYETEVGILEKTLKQLKAHEWGASDNASALAEALSMDRGQQIMSDADRKQAAKDILEQQLSFLGQLEQVMEEQFFLCQYATGFFKQNDTGDGNVDNEDNFSDLKEILHLTPEQQQQLAGQASGWEEEYKALQTVKVALTEMKENDWLWNEDCNAVSSEFLNILHKNQVNKFLLWCDHNQDAIDELDCISAPEGIPQGPVFSFGVESNPEGLLEEDNK